MRFGLLVEKHSQDIEVMNDVRLVLTTLSNPSLNGLLVQKKPKRSLLNRIEISETSIENENVSESRSSLSLLSYSCFSDFSCCLYYFSCCIVDESVIHLSCIFQIRFGRNMSNRKNITKRLQRPVKVFVTGMLLTCLHIVVRYHFHLFLHASSLSRCSMPIHSIRILCFFVSLFSLLSSVFVFESVGIEIETKTVE